MFICIAIFKEWVTKFAVEMTSLSIIRLGFEKQEWPEAGQVVQTIRNGCEQIQHIQRRHEDKNIKRENKRLSEESRNSKNLDISKMESQEGGLGYEQ